jgi:hypothetical protein
VFKPVTEDNPGLEFGEVSEQMLITPQQVTRLRSMG